MASKTHENSTHSLSEEIRKSFSLNKRILSFDEYLTVVAESPKVQLRNSAQYLGDMLEYFGTAPASEHRSKRFKLFDFPVNGQAHKIVGQEEVQNHIFRSVRSFVRQGSNNKLILLHGPNGSAKSSIVHALMGGMERYSELPEGAQYTLNWIFPPEAPTKGQLGMTPYSGDKESLQSFAHLQDSEIGARINCDLKDHPLLIIPRERRMNFLSRFLGDSVLKELEPTLTQLFRTGDPCYRCKQVLEALLVSHNGNFEKVLRHIQVERFYYSQRYRHGLVTIEPQMHVDAHYQQLSLGRNLSALPPALQSMQLSHVAGDLIDANRGIVEFSDLLKRPVDTFKYLLIACESGAVNVGPTQVHLDTVMLGSTNEVQLDAFKEFPDFTSFKARLELIRVPYLLRISDEKEIYEGHLSKLKLEKAVAPHVASTIASWAVLTRLKKPNSMNYPPGVSTLVASLKPYEKAKLYDSGEIPGHLTPEDRKLLKNNIRRLLEEYGNVPYYEGRTGASVREMKSVLFDATQNTDFPCLSPLAVLVELEKFIKRSSEYEFLRQEIKDGYHDFADFILTVRSEYLAQIDREVRESMGLYEQGQWEDFIRKYVHQITSVLKNERVMNPITKKLEDPDMTLISEFEKIVGAPDGNAQSPEITAFRQNVLSALGAWSLDNPNTPMVYAKVFPDFMRRLEKHYYGSQKAVLMQVHKALMVYGKSEFDPNSEGGLLAMKTLEHMKTKLGYPEEAAKEVIIFLMGQKYR